MIYLVILLIIALGISLFFLHRKQVLDYTEAQKLEKEITKQQSQRDNLKYQIDESLNTLSQLQIQIQNLKEDRYKDIEEAADSRRKAIAAEIAQAKRNADERIAMAEQLTQNAIEQAENTQRHLQYFMEEKKAEYEKLIEPFQLIEQQEQDKLFYTIQVPEEYHEDIQYLSTVVADKIKHPDIINKLIWQEYIKPRLDETCKRVGIEEQAGIYKITNIQNQKCYVGKGVNVKKRIVDHVKGSLGISTIADQTIHQAMKEAGLWNWTFEVINYCDKEELGEKEKFYIDLFKAQEWGYNKRSGG